MRFFLILVVLWSIGPLYSQNGFFIMPDIDANLVDAKDMVVDDDTIVTYGSIGLGNPNKWGQYFAKYDTLGNIIQTSFIVLDSVVLSSSHFGNLIKTENGGYAMFGTYHKYNQDSTELFIYTYLLKVNHDLSLDFIKFYENPGYKTSLNHQLIFHNNGYYLLGGEKKEDEQEAHWFIRFVDTDGAVLWKKSYYIAAETFNYIRSVKLLNDNELVILGRSTADMPGVGGVYEDGFVYPIMMAIDTLGDIKWKWNWDGAKTGIRDVPHSFIATKDGGFMFSGTRVVLPTGNTIAWHPLLTKLDADLNIAWRMGFDTISGFPAQMRSLLETPDSNYIVSGGFRDYIYHRKFALDGQPIWERLDSTWTDEYTWHSGSVQTSALLSSGSIVSAGYMSNPDKGFVEWNFVMKLSPDGCMDTLACWPVSVDDVVQDTDHQLDVYPNPATDVVYFSLSQDPISTINKRIIIVDLAGRMVQELRYDGDDIAWNLSGVKQGLYFYRLEMGGKIVDVGSIVVMD